VEFVHSRVEAPEAVARSAVSGRVVGGLPPGETLIRLTDSQAHAREQRLAADHTFVFAGLPAGRYRIEVAGHPEIQGPSDLTLDGQNEVAVELMAPIFGRLAQTDGEPRHSAIAGLAPHAAGQPARIVDALGNEWTQVVSHDDRFCFQQLPAGVYTLTVAPGYHQDNLALDGNKGLEVIFAELLPAWEAEVANAGSLPGFSVVRVEVEGKADLPVHIWKEDWEGMMRRTGSKPDYGPHVLEFSPLGPGHYMIEPEGLGVWTDVTLTGLETIWVNFRRSATPAAPNIVRPFVQSEKSGDAPVPPAPPPYLYVATPPTDPQTLLALLHFVAEIQPQIGNSLEEALKADRVILVGAQDETMSDVAKLLSAAGAQVEPFAPQAAPLDHVAPVEPIPNGLVA
jgi:hypothetical protein